MAENKINPDSLAKVVNTAERVAESENRKLVINFDEHFAEYNEQNTEIELTFEGEQFRFPNEMPAEVFAYILKNGAKLNDSKGVELLRMIIGDEFIEAMSKSRAPFRLVVDKVLSPIMSHYGMSAGHQDDLKSKNVKTPVS